MDHFFWRICIFSTPSTYWSRKKKHGIQGPGVRKTPRTCPTILKSIDDEVLCHSQFMKELFWCNETQWISLIFFPIFLWDKPNFLREGAVICKLIQSKNKLLSILKIWALDRPWKNVLYKFLNEIFENWLFDLEKKYL